MRWLRNNFVGSSTVVDANMVSIFEILPVGIIQGLSPVVSLVVTVNEPGAKTPERGRRSVRAEKITIVGLKKRA